MGGRDSRRNEPRRAGNRWRSSITGRPGRQFRWTPKQPVQYGKPDKARDREADRADLGGGVHAVVRRVQEHHREQEDQHDKGDRAEDRMSAAALEHVPEPDHEGGMLQE